MNIQGEIAKSFAKVWAEDDNLWTTQENVEAALTYFATAVMDELQHWQHYLRAFPDLDIEGHKIKAEDTPA